MLLQLYERLILSKPRLVLVLVALIVAFFAYHSPQFYLDASSDSLVLENNKELEYYRSVAARYSSDDFLIVTYTPKQSVFSSDVLADIKRMRDDFDALDGVSNVVSIFDVPLLQSPPVTFSDLTEKVINLDSPEADIALAEKEFKTSPLYSDVLMSRDGTTTALLAYLKLDKMVAALLEERNALLSKRLNGGLTDEEDQKLSQVSQEYDIYKRKAFNKQTRTIAAVRDIMAQYEDKGELHLGGVPMIVVDSIEFIRSDIVTFGIGVVCFLIVILVLAFRHIYWILLSMANCALVALTMIGLLGFLGWPVTAVSSNFLSLLLIITLSLAVHLIVYYREQVLKTPNAKQVTLVRKVVEEKIAPCFYTSITTMVAFSSFTISGIRPVIDFGIMMTIGMAVALVCSFTFFPAALVLMPKIKHKKGKDVTGHITLFFASIIEKANRSTLFLFTVLSVVSVIGITWLTVENRFIDYYKESTEIYQGMELIDTKLGGTTPLDIVIDAPVSMYNGETTKKDAEPDITQGYWYNSFIIEDIAYIHDYLESLPETGKVLSFDTTMQMIKLINERSVVDSLFLALLDQELSPEIKEVLFDPYISKDGNQLRFSTRVFESQKSLKRSELLEKIRTFLIEDMELEPEQIHLTGMVVLYNDLLQSLFRSQILTLGVVFVAIMFMFMLSFRSLNLALIAIIPNIFASLTVLGLMGLLGIPLDIMTITIAAICIGIAVDNTIHYVHRFKEEFPKDRHYWNSVKRSHGTIGHAMYYTTVTITLGFSILVLSNFVPTIYFGLLTGLSMIVALLADLMLLPLLLVLFKPFGRS